MYSKVKILILLFFFAFQCSKSYSITKQSKLAGTWYPSDKAKLLELIISQQAAKPSIESIASIIVPHAGYMYSAHIAAKAYKAISFYKPDIIIIIGPSHYEYYSGCALPIYDAITTPLGKVIIDKKTINNLTKQNLFAFNNNAFEPEHSVEIQLPFIQYYFPDIPVVPILSGTITIQQAQDAAYRIIRAIAHYKKPLFIISSDFTHHGPRFGYTPYSTLKPTTRMEHIKTSDLIAIEQILSNNPEKFDKYCESTGITICGRNAILIGLSLFSTLHTKELVAYSTSATITGDYDNTVSYAAIVMTGKLKEVSAWSNNSNSFFLSEDDKQFLLTLARKSIETMLFQKSPLHVKGNVPSSCNHNAGAFVTLTINGNLRGCIGYIEPIKPLYQTVIECASNAAFNDPRFEPITKDEFNKLHIEISVLSPLKQVATLDEVRLGTDGLFIVKGNRRGVLLPQVATEFGFTREQFFEHTCQKASIYPFEYDSVTIYTFTATIFSEHDNNKKRNL